MAMLPRLVTVPGGTFVMGNDGGRVDERPAHQVELSAFRAATHPVSNREYAAALPGLGLDPPQWFNVDGFNDPEQPVVGVSWFDAVAYCDWLARQSGIPFRLPTEAEREFASLGGLVRAEWPWPGPSHPIEAELAALKGPHVPRPECANSYGLRCMAENVHEWCSDWYDASYYAVSPATSPMGPESGARKASRGGAWRHSVKFTALTARSSLPPAFRYSDYGFRVYADA